MGNSEAFWWKLYFVKFLLPLNFQKTLGYKENNTKYRSLSWKPRSHAGILIYRTWRIIHTFKFCSFKFVHKSEEFIKLYKHAEIIETKKIEEMDTFCKKSNYKYYFVFQTSLIAIFEIVNLLNVKTNFL